MLVIIHLVKKNYYFILSPVLKLLITEWISGLADGWNAWSGYYYNEVNDTRYRFLPEPFGCNDTSIPGIVVFLQLFVFFFFWKDEIQRKYFLLRKQACTYVVMFICFTNLHQIRSNGHHSWLQYLSNREKQLLCHKPRLLSLKFLQLDYLQNCPWLELLWQSIASVCAVRQQVTWRFLTEQLSCRINLQGFLQRNVRRFLVEKLQRKHAFC